MWSYMILMQSDRISEPPLSPEALLAHRKEEGWSGAHCGSIGQKNTFSVYGLPPHPHPRPLAQAAWVFFTEKATFLRFPYTKRGPQGRGSSWNTDQTVGPAEPGFGHTSHTDGRIHGPEAPLLCLPIAFCKLLFFPIKRIP